MQGSWGLCSHTAPPLTAHTLGPTCCPLPSGPASSGWVQLREGWVCSTAVQPAALRCVHLADSAHVSVGSSSCPGT